MGAKTLPMKKLREILRLKYESGLSHRAIAGACRVGVGTVSLYVGRAREAGLGWPLPEDLDDSALEAILFARSTESAGPRPRPDCAHLHRELKRTGVTLSLLWIEYLGVHADGYRYSQFCEIYRRWAKKLKPSMRQQHVVGKRGFVDFSGKRPHLVDRKSGELIAVELFVGVLGASNYTYAEATLDQTIPSWVSAHVRMLEYWQGCPEILVPDNLRSGVTRACRYEPDIHRTYQDLARHYGAVVIPARVRHPKDKAKVESAVQVAQRWILARLRDETFFSLGALNRRIREFLEELNGRPMQKLGMSRRELFEQLERPALRPLPLSPYELAQWWPQRRVNIDYHVEVDKNYYSVPFQLLGERVDARCTSTVVEIYLKDRRVSSHKRLFGRGKHATRTEHMPRSHRAHAEWTPSRLIGWAEKTGEATGRLVAEILRTKPHPEQGYRACLGIMRLGRTHGAERLEAACARAGHLRAVSYRSVKNILSSGMDRVPLDEESSSTPAATPAHENIRGAAYYAPSQENEPC